MQAIRIAIRNVAGMPHFPGSNPYRTQAIQAEAWRGLVATGADIIVANEASGVNVPFEAPPGFRAKPISALSREGGSVIAVADHIDAELGWRPDHHPVIKAFTCYLDFAIVRPWGTDVAVCAFHAPTTWWGDLWRNSRFDGPAPKKGCRPAPSDHVLDAVIEVLADWPEAMILGDTNEDPRYRDDPGAAAFHARARGAGYTEAVSTVFGGPVRTNFCGRETNYQNDHAYLTALVAGRLEQVAVFNEPAPGRSDHAGIVLTFTNGRPLPTTGRA